MLTLGRYLNRAKVLTTVLATIGFLGGCSPAKQKQEPIVVSPQRKADVTRAYQAGLAAIMRESKLNPDTIWGLNQIVQMAPDDRLQKFIEEKTAILPKQPGFCAIISDAPRAALPEIRATGFAKYVQSLQAPFGTPTERAISFLEDFLSTQESSYVLTHQFLVLVWAEQMGLELPKQLTDRKEDLLKQILREQQKDHSFSDLYAERTALLLHYDKPSARDVEKWIDTILAAQLKDGRWWTYPALIDYDGETTLLKPLQQHSTVLSLWALQSYLHAH